MMFSFTRQADSGTESALTIFRTVGAAMRCGGGAGLRSRDFVCCASSTKPRIRLCWIAGTEAASSSWRPRPDTCPTQESIMKVCDCMSSEVKLASPDDPIAKAAMMMAQNDFGVLPVGENDRL